MFEHTDITGAFEFLYDMPVLLVVLKKIASLSIPKGLYIAIEDHKTKYSQLLIYFVQEIIRCIHNYTTYDLTLSSYLSKLTYVCYGKM